MLIYAYLFTKIGADTAENEQHCAEILLIGRRVAGRDPIHENRGRRRGDGGGRPGHRGPDRARRSWRAAASHLLADGGSTMRPCAGLRSPFNFGKI